ncbi:MAG TPA: GNAT family N-acetyltransferase [Sphingomonas sp.]
MIESHPRLIVPDVPRAEDYDAILAGLAAHNRDHAGRAIAGPLAVLIVEADGATIGGLWGRTSFDWLQIELLFVPGALRGQAIGRGLMAEAERIAVTRGCCGAWLDTFSFQARGFYEALNYEVLATLPDHPRGEARHFLRKLLPPA